jgi:hypothetical protein
MRNLNRESFFETLKEKMTELSEIFIEHNVPNFEFYSLEDDEIEDEEIKRITEILRDASDVVERNL